MTNFLHETGYPFTAEHAAARKTERGASRSLRRRVDETCVFAAKSVCVIFHWNCQLGTALAGYCIFRTIPGVIAFLHFRSGF